MVCQLLGQKVCPHFFADIQQLRLLSSAERATQPWRSSVHSSSLSALLLEHDLRQSLGAIPEKYSSCARQARSVFLRVCDSGLPARMLRTQTGRPLSRIFEQQQLGSVLGSIAPLLAEGDETTRRQDREGCLPTPSVCDFEQWGEEERYIHYQRLVAVALDDSFQYEVRTVLTRKQSWQRINVEIVFIIRGQIPTVVSCTI